MRLQFPAFLLVGLVSALRKQKVPIFYDVSVAYTREQLVKSHKFVSTGSRTEDFKRSFDELSTEVEASFDGFGATGSAAFAMEQMSDYTIESKNQINRTSEDTVVFQEGRYQVYRVVTKTLNIGYESVSATEKTYIYDYDPETNDPCKGKTIRECHQYWDNLAREYLNANLIPPGETPLDSKKVSTGLVRYTKQMEVDAHMQADWHISNLDYVETRAYAWSTARDKLIEKLKYYNVGTDQIISIDAHNNGEGEDSIFSAQWNKDLPYGKHISAMRWGSNSISYSKGSWASQYEQSAQLIRDQVPCGRVIATTGSVNEKGSQVFWTFYVPDEDGRKCHVEMTASHKIEVDYRLTGYDEITTYLKTYKMSSGFRDSTNKFKMSASASGSYSGVSASARFALSKATQRTAKNYKDEAKEQKFAKKFGANSVQGWLTIRNTVRLNGQTVTYVQDIWKDTYADDQIPSIEYCQVLANQYLREELNVRQIDAADTNTAARVFDDNLRATVYTSVISEKIEIPKRESDKNIGWFEDRAYEDNIWNTGGNNIKKFLIRENIGTGQIVWIDAHNNGKGERVIMSVIYNKNLPYGQSAKYLNYFLENHDGSWVSMYRDSNKHLSQKMGTGNRVIGASGSVNMSGRQVFFTWYTQHQLSPNDLKRLPGYV